MEAFCDNWRREKYLRRRRRIEEMEEDCERKERRWIFKTIKNEPGNQVLVGNV